MALHSYAYVNALFQKSGAIHTASERERECFIFGARWPRSVRRMRGEGCRAMREYMCMCVLYIYIHSRFHPLPLLRCREYVYDIYRVWARRPVSAEVGGNESESGGYIYIYVCILRIDGEGEGCLWAPPRDRKTRWPNGLHIPDSRERERE